MKRSIGGGKAEREYIVETITILDYKVEIVAGGLYEILLARCDGLVQQSLGIANDAVGFGQYLREGVF
jgi:hypothetical protein